MKIKFQADNDLHEDILRAAKRIKPGMDFQRAPELNLHTGIPDPEVLRLCAEENRILVTHDRHTMTITSLNSYSSGIRRVFSSSVATSLSAKRQNGWSSIGQRVKPKNTKIK